MLLPRIVNISENVRRLMSNFHVVSCILSGLLVPPPPHLPEFSSIFENSVKVRDTLIGIEI